MKEEDKDLVELITNGEIEKAKKKFTNREESVNKALKEWNVEEHEIMKRPGKTISNGEIIESWNLPISYQKKIVQSSVAFLFGKPIKIKEESEGTEDVYKILIDLMKDMRMSTKDQENAKNMFSETESAKLFVEYRDTNITDEEALKSPGLVKIKCILLAKSLGDTLHVSFDSFGVMRAFGREYSVKSGNIEIPHFDIYMADTNYFCKKENGSWVVDPKENRIGKIPVVYYLHPEKQAEWSDVQKLIERREYLTSTRADNNDRSGDPILVLEGDVVDLPEPKKVGKVVQLGIGAKASYLVPQMSVDMVANEKEDLKELIHYLTDTPDLSMDKMSSIGLTSGKAIEMAFFGCLLKAMGRHGFFEEAKDREINIILAFMEKIIHVGKSEQIKKLKTSIEFGNPLPDNLDDLINILSTSTGGKSIMSQKTAVGLNPMIKDAEAEIIQINEESVSDNPDDI